MLTKMRVKNFKAWKDSGEIRLAPLTVLFGTNSAGKSSLGHLLLALKQTAASADRRRALHTGDDASLIDLGTFSECLHGHDTKAALDFSLSWKLDKPLEVINPLEKTERYKGSKLSLDCTLEASPSGQPIVRKIHYSLGGDSDGPDGADLLEISFGQPASGKPTLKSEPYHLVFADGRKWPLDAPDKFYRISDRSMARYKNADFLTDFALATERLLSGLSYLGPLRERPRRTYPWSGNIPESVGPTGEHTIACLLAAKAEETSLNRGFKKKNQPFKAFIASWLVELGVIESFDVNTVAAGRKDYEVKVKTSGASTAVDLPDVGFGVSQVLPALVQAFYCAPGSIVWMEQPEIHLHPQVQSGLADVFISAIRASENGQPRNVQLIIETHSEHFLNRLQRRIAEELVTPEDVAIYFCEPGANGSSIRELEVNEYGDISNWPDHFFGDEMGDLVARTEAAAQRKSEREEP